VQHFSDIHSVFFRDTISRNLDAGCFPNTISIMKSQSTTSRRSFLTSTALTGTSLAFPWVSVRNVLGANSRLNIAAIGAGGKGGVDIGYCAEENVVALCDVDTRNAAGSFKKFPKARIYEDFRVLLEKENHHIDAVTISTPDHTHAHPAILAMRSGKHVYCQKPMTHTVEEARMLTQIARETGVVTQMGNQGHSQSHSRRLVELIRAGVLGEVRQAHVWTDRPIWPQGLTRPKNSQPAPDTMNWDLWLGPAPKRPYHASYAPFNWRGWWDFGTGALGDMGCHNMDLAFFSLDLRDPIEISGSGEGGTSESPPKASRVHWKFPANDTRGPVEMTWYDGGRKPDPSLVRLKTLPGNGCILMGTKDTLYVPSYWGAGSFLSGATMEDHNKVEASLPRWPGGDQDNDKAHHHEWIAACKGEAKALSDFDYAGPMTESVLLGNVALRTRHTIQWDAKQMQVTNDPHANQYIRKHYRKGWELPS
jgi:predicted dehydrogenase